MNQQELSEIENIRYAITHEIRGALTISKGYSEFARRGKFGFLKPEVKKAFESIERMSDRITSVASNLNEFIKFHYQKRTISKRNISNAEFLELAIKNVQLEASKKRIPIETSISEDLSFQGDEQALEIILTNLLRNAIQFSIQEKPIKVRVEAIHPELLISVKDQGVGLSDLDKKRIWTNPEEIRPDFGKKGSCFGLRVSRMLIEQHGGSIEINSEGKGRGTHVSIHIPGAN
ncbi:MAG: sensor histidine kinase [Candidatus Thorarchaeota archaeon]